MFFYANLLNQREMRIVHDFKITDLVFITRKKITFEAPPIFTAEKTSNLQIRTLRNNYFSFIQQLVKIS